MKKLLALTTAAVLCLSGAAHASTLITLGPTSSDISYGAGGALVANVDLSTLSPAQLALTGNAQIVNPAVTLGGQYKAPDGGVVFGNNYLAVLGSPTPAGTATYNFAPNVSTFGFTWGSVDAYNTLTLVTTNATYVLTGSTLASGISAALLGTVSLGSSDEDVMFKDTAGTFLSAKFESSQNSFEAANFDPASAVPLPASLPLFGTVIVGFAALAAARRRKSA